MEPANPAYWPHDADVEVYGFDDIPGRRDLVLIGSDEIELLRQQWVRYLAEPDGTTPPHPNEFLRFLWCAVEAHGADSCDLNICISMNTRFHQAVLKLPRSRFVTCVHFWNYAKRPYLVIDQDWFNQIPLTHFSLYALVDAIGMRRLLETQGRVERDQATALRDGIDRLARRHSDHAFMTFADNVHVKTNWTMMGDAQYEGTYRPERFMELLQEIRQVFRAALRLDSYAVVTQGANLVATDGLVSVSPERNHVFFGSLGTPFAQLFDMTTQSGMRSEPDFIDARDCICRTGFF